MINKKTTMTFINYILNHAERENNICSIYKCKITGFVFSWEDSKMHFNFLIKNKLIEL